MAIDACAWQWPIDADVREIAQAISALDNEFDLNEQDAHDYLSRAVLRFEPILDVFPDPERAGTIPFFATAALLIAYRREGRHWWEYLDVIEKALEDAAPLTEEAAPAVIFLARKTRALNEQKRSRLDVMTGRAGIALAARARPLLRRPGSLPQPLRLLFTSTP